jgi:hypothetical protein
MLGASRRALENVIAALRAENSDLREQVRFLTQAHHDRETKLIDRIIALSSTAAASMVIPRPERPPRQMSAEAPKVNFPGMNLEAPSPPAKGLVGVDDGDKPLV